MKIGLTIRDRGEYEATGNIPKYAKQVCIELTPEQIKQLSMNTSEYVSDVFIIVEPQKTEQWHH